VPEPASGRFVTVTRAADGARLYLRPLAEDAWLVTNVVAAGLSADPHLSLLPGRVLGGCLVLRWAGGSLPSAAILEFLRPALPPSV
jgi:hypothetical protein